MYGISVLQGEMLDLHASKFSITQSNNALSRVIRSEMSRKDKLNKQLFGGTLLLLYTLTVYKLMSSATTKTLVV